MIEISRNIAIGQYVNASSVMHRLDPRFKVVALVAIIVLASLCSTFTAFAAMFVVALITLGLSNISLRFIAMSMWPALIFVLIFFIPQAVFYQPTVAHPHVLWSWWLLRLTLEGVIFAAQVNLRALLLYYFVNLLTFTTTLVDTTDGVESLLSPLQRIGIPVNETTLVMVVALKFVPIFITELERLIKARAARGVKVDSGNFVQRVMNLSPILIPLIVNGFRRAETLAVAMEARGYHGGKGRTKLRQLHYGWRDLAAFLLLIGVCAEVLLLNARAVI